MFVETEAPSITTDPLEAIPVSPAIRDRDEVLRVLRGARALIARPYGWTRRRYVGQSLHTDNGLSYCSLGAIAASESTFAAYGPRTSAGATAASILSEIVGDEVHRWNDSRPRGGKKEVLEAFDRAIARAEEG